MAKPNSAVPDHTTPSLAVVLSGSTLFAQAYLSQNLGTYSAEEIRCVFDHVDDNSTIILSNLHKNLCCGCSLESPRRGDSNEHPHHRFL